MLGFCGKHGLIDVFHPKNRPYDIEVLLWRLREVFSYNSCLTNIQFTSLVRFRSGLLFHLFSHIAAASAALLFYPRFALIKIMLSHRRQKCLPFMVVINRFLSNFVVALKVLALSKAITTA